MRTLKKILFFSLLFCFYFVLLSCGTAPENPPPENPPHNTETTPTDRFIFKLEPNEDAYYISKYNGSDSVVILPDKYNGKPIIGIESSAVSDILDITRVIIPDSIKSIGHHAFSGCDNLTSITIGKMLPK